MHMITRSLRRLRKEEDGAGMVEFAIVVVVLFTLIFAIIDFGRALFLYNNIGNAARDGARFGSVLFVPLDVVNGPCGDATLVTAVEDSTEKLVMGFQASQTAIPVVTMTCTGGEGTTPGKVTVQVSNVAFRPVTPLPFFTGMQLSRSATVRYEGSPANF